MQMKAFSLALAVAGLVSAQQAPQPRPGFRGQRGSDGFEQRLTNRLGLNAVQQNQVHTALAEAAVQSQGMGQQMLALRAALTAAVKAGSEAQIDSVTQQISQLQQQQSAIRAKSMAKVYGSLTTDQKAKVGPNLELLMNQGPSFGPRPPRRGPPNGNAPAPLVQ
jgi:Spy/CpxP family protein refolding chaperone